MAKRDALSKLMPCGSRGIGLHIFQTDPRAGFQTETLRLVSMDSPCKGNPHYDYSPMESSNAATLAADLLRRAEERFGRERAEALKNDLQQLAAELAALRSHDVSFEDEP